MSLTNREAIRRLEAANLAGQNIYEVADLIGVELAYELAYHHCVCLAETRPCCHDGLTSPFHLPTRKGD